MEGGVDSLFPVSFGASWAAIFRDANLVFLARSRLADIDPDSAFNLEDSELAVLGRPLLAGHHRYVLGRSGLRLVRDLDAGPEFVDSRDALGGPIVGANTGREVRDLVAAGRRDGIVDVCSIAGVGPCE